MYLTFRILKIYDAIAFKIIHQIFMINHKNVNSLADIDQLQTTCKKKSLDGSFVTIHPVFVTNCIIVRGYSENITGDKLEWYFENKINSGHHNLPTYQMTLKSDNVEFVQNCGGHFENGDR
jgi:hypothetical protein